MALRPLEATVVTVGTALEARSLAFGFPGRTIGSGVSLALEAGETMCVIGPNGGGKTTLLRTLLGLVPSLAGEVLLEGRPLASLPRAAVARQLGYVPQGAAAYFAYSVREFVLMGRTAHVGVFSSPTRKDHSVAERALESLGIAALAEKPVTEISGGERQLALVARALAQEPRVLVMDEPTASLDYGNQVRVLGRMRALAEQGIAVLFSSHDPGHAFLAAGRALLLGEGRVLELGAPAEVIREDSLRRLYGVSVRIVQSPDGRNACLPSLGR